MTLLHLALAVAACLLWGYFYAKHPVPKLKRMTGVYLVVFGGLFVLQALLLQRSAEESFDIISTAVFGLVLCTFGRIQRLLPADWLEIEGVEARREHSRVANRRALLFIAYVVVVGALVF